MLTRHRLIAFTLTGFCLGFAMLGGVAAAADARTSSARASGPKAEVWETTADARLRLTRQLDVTFVRAPTTGQAQTTGSVIRVDPSQTFQTMTGFGASMTDASADLIQNNLSPAQRDALMDELFGSTPGLGLSFLRLTIGASDFSSSAYSYDDMPAGERDPTLAHFSLTPARVTLIPAVKDALRRNPDLTIMASPWSAPGWMKTSGSLIKGALKPDAYPDFARYLTRYVQAMHAEGIDLSLITLQNEPGFEPEDYPGMRVEPASRAAFIGQHLGPALAAQSPTTKILDYDHNWDLPSSPLSVLADPVASPYVAGVAWHCYAGDVAAQTAVHDAHPSKDAYFTECSGGEWAPDFGASFDWMVKTLIIGSTRNWAKGVLLWNLALDETHGPHLGGCGDCRGVVTINSKSGTVTRNPEYYALAHASRFIRPGALRIASDSADAGLDTVAFKNADDGSIVLIVLNSHPTPSTFTIRSVGKALTYRLPPGAVSTFVWPSREHRVARRPAIRSKARSVTLEP